MKQHCFNFREQHLWLSPERAIFWEDEKTLILSDSHFGKTGHFRKAGIPMPQYVFIEDLQRLFNLLQFYKPEQLIVVGDFFHSRSNKEHLLFEKWRNDFTQLEILLVKGNHDILHRDWYAQTKINVFDADLLRINQFAFMHDCADIEKHTAHTDAYFLTGHLHPGISIKGKSRQHLSFPCFYFNDAFAILPAFSKFSGLALINKKKADHVFAIVNGELVEI
ncbi:ligase-associated DNA damage response endonuclease PdeM [Parafilimonas terrae]|uniref:Putative phosphoesterase n=1 Tax=Parafilimonas terrae TaxID=1465490 RepID=A0A1I5YB25_9BACT|nr:ligase-associated DNA damage response endonuclease PdeM [Parafilimonas terrae]SFQ41422.1 putative phosphoesterase [Parafilimonas terrae]